MRFDPTVFAVRALTLLAVALALPATSAFGQGRWKVFTMNADGSDVKKISTNDTCSFGSPAWSHDGKRIAYDGGPSGFGTSHIFVHTLGEEQPQDIGLGHTPSFSPDDQQIAFFYPGWTRSGQKPGVWVMNADGKNREWISEGERPRWSPDGDKLVFVGGFEGFPSIYVYDTITLERTRILERGYDEVVGAAFSPDAARIVFIGYKGGNILQNGPNGELAVVDALAGGQPKTVVRGRVGWHPDWSPQGNKLLFRTADEAGVEQIQILDLEGDEEPVVLPNQFGKRNCDGAWSPDGKQIVFTSDRS